MADAEIEGWHPDADAAVRILVISVVVAGRVFGAGESNHVVGQTGRNAYAEAPLACDADVVDTPKQAQPQFCNCDLLCCRCAGVHNCEGIVGSQIRARERG